MHQLQLVTSPAAIQLCFSLLGLSLGLTPSPKHPGEASLTKAQGQAGWEVVAPADESAVNESAVDESAVDESAVDESAIRQLLQQPWVMSHWLTGHPLGQDVAVAVAWELGLTELLHSVLSLSLRAGSSALTDVCQPYMLRYAGRVLLLANTHQHVRNFRLLFGCMRFKSCFRDAQSISRPLTPTITNVGSSK